MKINEVPHAKLPEELKKKVLPLLEKGSNLLPPWVIELYYSYDHNMEYIATANSEKEYLRHGICFGSYAIYSDTLEDDVIHEIMHAYTTPIAAAARDALNDMDLPDCAKNAINKNITQWIEMSTEALKEISRHHQYPRPMNEE